MRLDQNVKQTALSATETRSVHSYKMRYFGNAASLEMPDLRLQDAVRIGHPFMLACALAKKGDETSPRTVQYPQYPRILPTRARRLVCVRAPAC
jgi:hypothetical protein